jgi:hypothetical protein
MDWPSLERWERFCVSVLAEDGRGPETALAVLAAAAEAARRWTPEHGPFGAYLERGLRVASPWPPPDRRTPLLEAPGPGDEEAWATVSDCVPHRALLPTPPERPGEAHARWVAPSWPTFATPVRRWLGARAFASWAALQGEGLRTTVASLHVALAVLRAEAGRACSEARRSLDAERLTEAFRRADLLLVHLADPEALARRLSATESAGASSPA